MRLWKSNAGFIDDFVAYWPLSLSTQYVTTLLPPPPEHRPRTRNQASRLPAKVLSISSYVFRGWGLVTETAVHLVLPFVLICWLQYVYALLLWPFSPLAPIPHVLIKSELWEVQFRSLLVGGERMKALDSPLRWTRRGKFAHFEEQFKIFEKELSNFLSQFGQKFIKAGQTLQ